MHISLQIKNRQGYLIAFILLLITYFLIFFIIKKLERDANSVTHSYAIINNLESIKAEITDAETGVRGYMITKDVRFLKPYNSGSKQVFNIYKELRSHTDANNKDRKAIDSLGVLLKEKLDFLSRLVTDFQRGGSILSPAIVSFYEPGKDVMDKILKLISELKSSEETLMNVRNENLKSFFQTMTIMAIISLGITIVTVLYSLATYNRENRAKEEADAKAAAYSQELEDRINELHQVNAELSELRRIEKFAASGRIARTIAHEVRNPLTNISLAAEQVRELGESTEDRDLLLNMIDRSVNRINQLVSDLLNSTRVEQLQYVQTDINTLVDEAIELAQDRLDLSHISVRKQYSDAIPALSIDREKIKLAFLNLIVNAIEAMEEGKGELDIRTYLLKERCYVEFSDNGKGMDHETELKLFEPYFTAKPKGNGLGLTHTQSIVINHKGSMDVQSQPGKGSTFTIILPLQTGVSG